MSTSGPIKVNCVGFSEDMGFEHYLFRVLKQNFDIELSENPDVLLYSVFNQDFRKYDCLRVFITGENVRPNFDECDFAFGFDYIDDPRNYRFPEYASTGDAEKLTEPKNIDEINRSKTKFCNFIYSNSSTEERIRFFQLLSAYKKVDSFGTVLNNMPIIEGSADRWNRNWKGTKLRFMEPYKFTIAFENTSHPGYTTEKIAHAMLCHSIAIYWGNPLIDRDFNSKSFINCHSHESFEKVIHRVIEIDLNKRLYRSMLEEPYFVDNRIPRNLQRDNIVKRWALIIDSLHAITPVAQRKIPYFRNRLRKTFASIPHLNSAMKFR